MQASDAVMLPMASSLTVSTRSMPCCAATSRYSWFSWLAALAFQKYAIAVSSAVRTALVADPYDFVSLKSVAY